MTTLSTIDRETFLAAIARHQRASWRVTAACAVAVTVLAVVVSVLMGPLLYAMIGLAFDVLNLVTPAPDVLGALFHFVDPVFSGQQVPPERVIAVGVLAALPGLALMGLLTWGLRHIWIRSPLFDAGTIPGRAPEGTVLAEERLLNVVEEMSIAAGIPVPRVVIVPGGVNAAACGRDQAHVTLLVAEEAPAQLEREQLEGMIAHLIASIADGDMVIGLRVATTLALFGLIARVSGSFNDRDAFWRTVGLWRVFVAPTAGNTTELLGALADPFHDTANPRRTARPKREDSNLTWREWLTMPFMGPVVLSGFLAGLVTQFFLEPLIALAWRQRKYMADATAVQLTRDPDALAGALARAGEIPQGIAAWTAHLAVAGNARISGPFGRSLVPIFPSLERRGKALARLGAHVDWRAAKGSMPWPAVVLITVLFSIAGLLMCIAAVLLTFVSVAISGLFTLVPAALLHLILRSVGR